MALPTLQRKLFKNDGYGPEIKDERLSTDITVKDWDSSRDYSANVLAKAGGDIYRSVAASGPGTAAGAVDPSQDDGTYWKILTDAGTLSGYATQSWVGNQGYAVDSDVIHVNGNEYIYGAKTIIRNLWFHGIEGGTGSDYSPWIWMQSLYLQRGTFGPFGYNGGLLITDKNGAWYSGIYSYTASNRSETVLLNHGGNVFSIMAVNYSDNTYAFAADTPSSGQCLLGTSARRWKQLYATTSTINTSDIRLKSSISFVPDEILDVWADVDFVQFKFNDAVREKGANARIHNGLVAQRIDEVFKARGFDASRYGLFCHDEWEDESERRDENGNIISRGTDAGDMYSLRYEEALCMEAAYQRRRANRAEARISALEARLAALEAKLNG